MPLRQLIESRRDNSLKFSIISMYFHYIIRDIKNCSNINKALHKERDQFICHSSCFHLAIFSFCPNENVSFSYKISVDTILM